MLVTPQGAGSKGVRGEGVSGDSDWPLPQAMEDRPRRKELCVHTKTSRANDTKAGYESLIRSGLVNRDSLGRSMEPGEMPASGDMESRVAEGLRARGEVSGEDAAAPTF